MIMKLSATDIRRLGTLSRIEIDEAELEQLQADLNRILEFAAVLAEVDEDTAVYGLDWGGNVLRADETETPLGQAGALELAPAAVDGFIRVPRTVDG